uniref:Inactive phospholipase C-like protein 2 n=1 Tax=Seriola lalandi dorsalis TaxID=1841481 RepID=A0A3B4X0D4_SERLL
MASQLTNGDNPIFDESFEFQINLPELAMVRFVVSDGLDFPATTGQYTISLECLQPGYRHVPLQSLTGEELPHAKLFVHVWYITLVTTPNSDVTVYCYCTTPWSTHPHHCSEVRG